MTLHQHILWSDHITNSWVVQPNDEMLENIVEAKISKAVYENKLGKIHHV